MSKINNISEHIAALTQKATSANTQKGGDAFSKTLKEAMAPASQQTETTPTAATMKMAALNPAFLQINDTTSTSEVMNKTDLLLTRLDDYAKLLEDPSKTLKDMESVIDSIKQDADALNADAEKKLPEGSGIKKLVREFTIAANAEYFRFKRGDYA